MSKVIEFRKSELPKLKMITEVPRKVTMESPLVRQLERTIEALDAAEERRLETQRGDAFIREAITHIINKGEGLDAAVTCMIRRLQELKQCGE
jgi:hypothetical protein